MSLTPGTRFGAYQIVSLLGAGGMGEVYRAHDANLGRDVALKVLPDSMAQDPDRLARFEREAKALAALNHPNIAQVYGFESGALVMELLEGRTLREWLKEGALPARKAIDYGTQIARGLAAAHDRGIIHRDLKPENVFVLEDGHVKILDFGLARQVVKPATGATETVGAAGGTDPGTVMGTVGYMAPEQVRGGVLDARADLFALGAVLYELLTGLRAFARDTTAETMTAILKEDPPELMSARADLSPSIDRIVRHCLEKNPIERFHSARDVAFALEALSGSGSGSAKIAAVTAPPTKSYERWIWAAATSALAAIAIWLAMTSRTSSPGAPAPSYRLTMMLPAGLKLSDTPPPFGRIAISPDGQRLAFTVIDRSFNRRVWLQSLGDPIAHEVPGSAFGGTPYWSHDGKWLIFGHYDPNTESMFKIPADGGSPIPMASTAGEGSWGSAGEILFVPRASYSILRLPESGGSPTPVYPNSEKEGRMGFPTFLPDGRHFLFQFIAETGPASQSGTYLGSLDSAERKLVLPGQTSSQVSYSSGYVFTWRVGALSAQPFDLKQMTTTGEPVVIADDVEGMLSGGWNTAAFTVSPSAVAYQPSTSTLGSRLNWISRTGAVMSTVADSADYSNLELSPDGKRMLVSAMDPALRTRDIYVVDLERGVRQRLTFDPSEERSAVWSLDGKQIYYNSRGRDLYVRASDFSGGEAVLLKDGISKDPRQVTPDGKTLIYRRSGDTTSNDIWSLSLTPGQPAQPAPIVNTPFNENYASLSPDGRSMVFTSTESGQFEIYVTSLEPGGGKTQISSDNGVFPRWRHDGSEIFYINGENMMMAVPVKGTGANFQAGAPKMLFHVDLQPTLGSPFDVTADGQRFIVNAPLPVEIPPHLNVIVNWQSLLKK